MFSKMLANEGFNKFAGIAKSFMGWGALRGGIRGIKKGVGAMHKAGWNKMDMNYAMGGMDAGKGLSRLGGWATASGFQGGKRVGAAAARMGGTAAAVGGAADFLNPWGLGWGD